MDLYALRDGTEVEIRPIRADDGQRLRDSHARLSPESSYRRYLAVKPQLSAADARYLVEVDGCDHFALVATRHDGEEGIVAVARFIRLPDQPRTAEFAIVVGDRFQRQGLATELAGRLVEAALERGVNRFRATMLADNMAIHRVLEGVAEAPPDVRRNGPVSEVEIELAPRGTPRCSGPRRRSASASTARRRSCDDRAVRWKLTVRRGSQVQRRSFDDLDRALEALEAQGRELARSAPRQAYDAKFKRFDPVQQVIARLELAGPERLVVSVRAGVDIRGDGSTEAYRGRVRRQVIEERQDESAYAALRRELQSDREAGHPTSGRGGGL